MSQIANITVFDGAATPVSHTLVPEGVTRDKNAVTAEWREQLATVPKYAQVCLTIRQAKTKVGTYIVDTVLSIPVMETVTNQNAAGYTAAPKVAYVNRIMSRAFFHERSDITGRRLIRQMFTNLHGNVSTSVVPVTTGPVPEAIDQLVNAT